jgi:hypothetical protein
MNRRNQKRKNSIAQPQRSLDFNPPPPSQNQIFSTHELSKSSDLHPLGGYHIRGTMRSTCRNPRHHLYHSPSFSLNPAREAVRELGLVLLQPDLGVGHQLDDQETDAVGERDGRANALCGATDGESIYVRWRSTRRTHSAPPPPRAEAIGPSSSSSLPALELLQLSRAACGHDRAPLLPGTSPTPLASFLPFPTHVGGSRARAAEDGCRRGEIDGSTPHPLLLCRHVVVPCSSTTPLLQHAPLPLPDGRMKLGAWAARPSLTHTRGPRDTSTVWK